MPSPTPTTPDYTAAIDAAWGAEEWPTVIQLLKMQLTVNNDLLYAAYYNLGSRLLLQGDRIGAAQQFQNALAAKSTGGEAMQALLALTPTSAPTPTNTSSPALPTATRSAVPTSTRVPVPATPTPQGVNGNPWGYNFTCCTTITSPPSNFCSYFACIANFWNGRGYVMQCKDATFGKSGGIQGSCSSHGGNAQALLAP